MKDLESVHLERAHRIGKEMKSRLDSHMNQWGMGIPFKTIISNRNHDAKMMGMTVSELGDLLQELGYIEIINTMSGARYVFASGCGLSHGEMLTAIMEQERNKKLQREKLKNESE